jgi:hypothetical protein
MFPYLTSRRRAFVNNADFQTLMSCHIHARMRLAGIDNIDVLTDKREGKAIFVVGPLGQSKTPVSVPIYSGESKR